MIQTADADPDVPVPVVARVEMAEAVAAAAATKKKALRERAWTFALPKLALVSYACAYSPVANMMVPYFNSKGYNEKQIGVLLSVTPFVMFVSAPLWTFTADRLKSRTLVWCFAIVLASSAFLSYLWGAVNIVGLFVVVIVSAFARAPMNAFCDSTIIDKFGSENYGKQRMWESASWGLCSFAIGYAIDAFGYTTIFITHVAFSVFFLVFAILMCRMPSLVPQTEQQHNKKAEVELNFRDKLRATLQWDIFTILLRAFIYGGALSQSSWLYLFLKQRFPNVKNLVGLYGASVLAGITLESPVFYFSSFFLRKMGWQLMMAFSQIMVITRTFSYTLINNPWLVLLLESFPSYAMFYAAAALKLSELFPKGLEATAQGSLYGCLQGLGFGVGYIVGGVVFRELGPENMYRGCAMIMSGMFVLSTLNDVVVWLYRRRKARYQQLTAQPAELEDIQTSIQMQSTDKIETQ